MALSSMEAEYLSLGISRKLILPIIWFLKGVDKAILIIVEETNSMQILLHRDNTGSLVLSKM